MWLEPIPSRIFTSTGKRRSSGTSSGAKVRGEGMPCASRKRAISSLSTVRRVGAGSGMKTSAPSARKRWRVSASTIRSNSEHGTTQRTSWRSASSSSRSAYVASVAIGMRSKRSQKWAAGASSCMSVPTTTPPSPRRSTASRKACTTSTRRPTQVSSTFTRRPFRPGRPSRPVAPLYTPSLRSSTPTVRARICRSRASERCSTYQTSSSMRSLQGRLVRPCTWAQPVSPGRTSRRRRCRSVYCSTW